MPEDIPVLSNTRLSAGLLLALSAGEHPLPLGMSKKSILNDENTTD